MIPPPPFFLTCLGGRKLFLGPFIYLNCLLSITPLAMHPQPLFSLMQIYSGQQISNTCTSCSFSLLLLPTNGLWMTEGCVSPPHPPYSIKLKLISDTAAEQVATCLPSNQPLITESFFSLFLPQTRWSHQSMLPGKLWWLLHHLIFVSHLSLNRDLFQICRHTLRGMNYSLRKNRQQMWGRTWMWFWGLSLRNVLNHPYPQELEQEGGGMLCHCSQDCWF